MASISANDRKVAIVMSEFNSVITESLLNGATDAFFHNGGTEDNLKVYKVPGAIEIPGAVSQVLKHQQVDAIVTLGAVIRGGTPHFDYVAGECANGVSELSRNHDIPIIFGVLTTDDLQQALERAGTKASNKGWEAMEAALATCDTYREIRS